MATHQFTHDEKELLSSAINSDQHHQSYSSISIARWFSEKSQIYSKSNADTKVRQKRVKMCVLVSAVVFVLLLFSSVPIYQIVAEVDHNPINKSSNAVTSNCSDTNIICAEGFYESDNSCLPSCSEFNQDKHGEALMMQVLVTWTGWFGFITGLLALTVSAFKYKFMFKFPSILLVYMTISYCITDIFVIATSVNHSRSLYCKHHDLYQSIDDSTTFCTISGISFHYLLVNTTIWWFCHVSVIFYKLMLPLKAKRTEKYEKYIHIAIVFIGLLVPVPAVAVTLWCSEYVMVMFPPVLCFPSNDNIFYYSTILVLNVLIAVGVSMFIPMFWTVHKFQKTLMRRKTRRYRVVYSVAEVKLLVVLCYYIVFGILTILYFQLALKDQDNLADELKEYFACNHCGINSAVNDSAGCPQQWHQYTHTSVRAVSFIVMSLIPTAILIFMINWKKFGAFFKQLLFPAAWVATQNHKKDSNSTSDDGHRELSFHSALSPYSETSAYTANAFSDTSIRETERD